MGDEGKREMRDREGKREQKEKIRIFIIFLLLFHILSNTNKRKIEGRESVREREGERERKKEREKEQERER